MPFAEDQPVQITSSWNPVKYIPRRTTNAVAGNALASGIQAADTRGMMGPNRGVQAGAPGSSYRKSIQSARAMAGARQQYLEAQMADLERNREAQLASDVGRAGEFARMGAVAQDLSEADWSQRYTRALADQRINQARRQLSLAGLSAGADLASPIVGRILGGLIS